MSQTNDPDPACKEPQQPLKIVSWFYDPDSYDLMHWTNRGLHWTHFLCREVILLVSEPDAHCSWLIYCNSVTGTVKVLSQWM